MGAFTSSKSLLSSPAKSFLRLLAGPTNMDVFSLFADIFSKVENPDDSIPVNEGSDDPKYNLNYPPCIIA